MINNNLICNGQYNRAEKNSNHAVYIKWPSVLGRVVPIKKSQYW